MDGLKGRFIVFEGPDGSGKSTQCKRLVALCREKGLEVCEVREPGGTPVGEQIRQILLHTKEELCLKAEMLLYMASRAQLVEQKIKPALKAGQVVIADRFIQSTYAYQGAAGGIPEKEIRAVGESALGGLRPDAVLLFDVDAETASKRTRGVEKVGKKKALQVSGASLFDDRIEQRNTTDVQNTIRDSYLRQAQAEPDMFKVIDARGDAERVWLDVLKALEELGGR